MSALSFTYLIKGFRLSFSAGYRRYVFIPLCINFLLMAIGFWLGLKGISHLLSILPYELPAWLSWANPIITILGPFFKAFVWIGLGGLLLFILASSMSLVVSLLASPFNSLLAEKVLKQELGKTIPEVSSWGKLWLCFKIFILRFFTVSCLTHIRELRFEVNQKVCLLTSF